jgi:U3 small nucleolar RNA-associated protein 25
MKTNLPMTLPNQVLLVDIYLSCINFSSDDYNDLFRGKIDDCFRIGIKVTSKAVKLYVPFCDADIIVASPLGLRTIVGSEADTKRDYDFLSSISLCIVMNCDFLMMQNWDHLCHIFSCLNQIPKKSHDCDFSRVQEAYLDGHGSKLRQTVLSAQFPFPELVALASSFLQNQCGRIKMASCQPRGCLQQLTMPKIVPRL